VAAICVVVRGGNGDAVSIQSSGGFERPEQAP